MPPVESSVKTSMPILKQRTFSSAIDTESSSQSLSRGMPENSGVSTLSTAAPRYSSISARYILPRQGTDLVNKIFCNGIAMSG